MDIFNIKGEQFKGTIEFNIEPLVKIRFFITELKLDSCTINTCIVRCKRSKHVLLIKEEFLNILYLEPTKSGQK